MVNFCGDCGTKRPPEGNFCTNCGKPFPVPFEKLASERVPFIINQLHERTRDFFKSRLPQPEDPNMALGRMVTVNIQEARKIPGVVELISLQQLGFTPDKMPPDSHVPVFQKLEGGFSHFDIESISLEAHLLAFANGLIFSGTNRVKEENHGILIDLEKLSQKLRSNNILGDIITLLVSLMSYKEFISKKSLEIVVLIAENVIKSSSLTVVSAQLDVFIYELKLFPYYQNVELEERFAQFGQLINDKKIREIKDAAFLFSQLARQEPDQYYTQFIPRISDMCDLYISLAPMQRNVFMLKGLIDQSIWILEQISKKFGRADELRLIERTKLLLKED